MHRGVVATPFVVAGLGQVREIAVGDLFTVALRTDGTLWGWGMTSSTNSCREGLAGHRSSTSV